MGFFNQPTAQIVPARRAHWSWDEVAASHELARRARSRKRANVVLGAVLFATSFHPVDEEQLKESALGVLAAAEKPKTCGKVSRPVFEL